MCLLLRKEIKVVEYGLEISHQMWKIGLQVGEGNVDAINEGDGR